MSIETIKVPDIGGAEGVEVIEICVAVGDQVAEEDSLIVLESDKASMEVPSPMAGKVVSLKIENGDSLSEGDIILELETDATAETTVDAQPAESSSVQSEQQSASNPATVEAVKDEVVSESAAATRIEKVVVPDIGGAEAVDVIEVCVQSGDQVAEGDSLVVLESDKASMEIPSPFAGLVVSLSIEEGASVSEGSALLEMEVAAMEVAAGQAPQKTAQETTAQETIEPSAPKESKAAVVSAENNSEIPSPAFASERLTTPSVSSEEEKPFKGDNVYAGPAVRKLAREMGLDITSLKGSGPRSRITKDDLKAFVKQKLTEKPSGTTASSIPTVPEVDFSKFGDVEVESLSKIHKVTAFNMHRSWLNVPHVTQFDDADLTDLEDFRKSLKAEAEKRGVKVTPLPFLLKAAALALKANPKFNASLHADGEHMVYKHYVHIGVAVDTPAGLMVPVLRDVDKKSIWDLAAESTELAQKAKDKKLMPADMQGGCFTISSLGGIGGQGFTPIVNTPEVAILGVSKLTVKPVWNGQEFEPRKMLPLSLSYDHRAINGADAGKFFVYLNGLLADVRRMVM